MNDEAQREQRLSELAHQFSTLARQGAHPSVEEFASANPDFAVEIRDLFPSLSLLEDQSKHPLHSLPPIPERLGDFTITRKIGQGGMGQVFEATQESLGRRVALKVLTVLYSNANAVARFSREAQIVSRLHHTNIVPIYSFGESNGVIYYAMQFIDGWSLDRIVGDYDGEATSKKKLIATPHRVARLGIEAASALAEAHACGVTHRDVKPANMLLDRTDKLWLTDFGLAQLQEVSDLTGPDDILGTMRYMPPERLSGNSGKLGDIYGLGISLYEILAGRPAYLAKDRSQLINQILNEAPPRIETLNGSVPIDLATIIHKCIAKPPGDRYQSAWELQEDLVRYSADLPIRARRLSPFGIAMRWAQRNRLLASALATAVAALAVVAIISTTFLVRENHYSRTLEFAIKETDKAKQGQLEEVYHNLVDAASAKQLSFRPGQRFESLNDLQAANKLLDGRLQLPDTQKQARIAELRDLAVSALTLIDVRNVGELANEKNIVTQIFFVETDISISVMQRPLFVATLLTQRYLNCRTSARTQSFLQPPIPSSYCSSIGTAINYCVDGSTKSERHWWLNRPIWRWSGMKLSLAEMVRSYSYGRTTNQMRPSIFLTGQAESNFSI